MPAINLKYIEGGEGRRHAVLVNDGSIHPAVVAVVSPANGRPHIMSFILC